MVQGLGTRYPNFYTQPIYHPEPRPTTPGTLRGWKGSLLLIGMKNMGIADNDQYRATAQSEMSGKLTRRP